MWTRAAGWAAGTEAAALRAEAEVVRTGAAELAAVPDEAELTEEPDEPVAALELGWLDPELDRLGLLVDPLEPPAGVGCGYETPGACGEGSGELAPVDPLGLDWGAGPAATPLPEALAAAVIISPTSSAPRATWPKRPRRRNAARADLADDDL